MRARAFDRPDRERPAFELPPERPKSADAPPRGRDARADEVPAADAGAARPAAAKPAADAPAGPTTDTLRAARGQDEPVEPDQAASDEAAPEPDELVPTPTPPVSQHPSRAALPPQLLANMAVLSMPPEAIGARPRLASGGAGAALGNEASSPGTAAASAPSEGGGDTPIETMSVTSAQDRLSETVDVSTGAAPLDALLTLAQAANPEPQPVANGPVAAPAGDGAPSAEPVESIVATAGNPPASRADRALAALTARQAAASAMAAPAQTEALVPAATAGTGEAKSEPAAALSFGEHLAKVGAEALVQAQQGQGGDGAPATTVRTDMAPPVLPPVPAAAPHPGPNGLAGVAVPHAAPPAHPVVGGVPIQAVPVEIGLKSLAGINRFDIRLDPDDLGQIDVRLDISEGHVRAHIVVERPEALLSLQRETSQLERALEQAGFRTGDEGVSLSLRQQGPGEQGGRGAEREAGASGPAPRGDEAQAESRPIRRYDWSRASGVDRHV